MRAGRLKSDDSSLPGVRITGSRKGTGGVNTAAACGSADCWEHATVPLAIIEAQSAMTKQRPIAGGWESKHQF